MWARLNTNTHGMFANDNRVFSWLNRIKAAFYKDFARYSVSPVCPQRYPEGGGRICKAAETQAMYNINKVNSE